MSKKEKIKQSAEIKETAETEETAEIEAESALPQNMVLVGDAEQADKKVYISQKTYRQIHKFTKDKTKNESGGMLIGKVVEEFGKSNVVIYGFIEAKYCEATPTTLTFTHKTWDYVHAEADKKYPDGKILGWIHTHPDFGIFLSEYDKFIQQNFFSGENQIAYVVDPIQKIEGFYVWLNGNIEKCSGFYVYDEIGEKIELETKESEKKQESVSERKSVLPIQQILIAVLALLVVILGVLTVRLSGAVKQLETNVTMLQIELGNQSQNITGFEQYVFGILEQQQTEQEGEPASEEVQPEPAVGETQNAT